MRLPASPRASLQRLDGAAAQAQRQAPELDTDDITRSANRFFNLRAIGALTDEQLEDAVEVVAKLFGTRAQHDRNALDIAARNERACGVQLCAGTQRNARGQLRAGWRECVDARNGRSGCGRRHRRLRHIGSLHFHDRRKIHCAYTGIDGGLRDDSDSHGTLERVGALEQLIDQCRLRCALARANLVQPLLELVRDVGHRAIAHRRRHALDRVRGAECFLDRFGAAARLEIQQTAIQSTQVLLRLCHVQIEKAAEIH